MNLPPLPVPTLPMDAAHTWALAAYYKALEKDGPDIDKSKSALEMAIRTYAEQYGRLCAEAERKRLMDGALEAIQSDTENGVKWLNIIEAERFRSQFPALNAWLAKENT